MVLTGFALLLLFSGHRLLIKSGIIGPLSPTAGSKAIQALLRHGFIIAILVIALGIGVEFWQTTYGFVIALLTILLAFALAFWKVGKEEVDVPAIVQNLVAAQVSQYEEREEEHRDQIKALTAAVSDLAAQRNRPDAPPGI